MMQLRERVAILLMLLVVGVAACQSAAPKGDPAALMREANGLLQQSNETTSRWTAEYGKAFMPQERDERKAQFEEGRRLLGM